MQERDMKIDYPEIAKRIRKSILQMVYAAKSSHVGSALSIVDILTVLYFRIMHISPKEPWNPDRDRFILSKGHACAALYATLAERGIIPKELLSTFCKDGSTLGGHSDCYRVPGIDAPTGSLGHGLSLGAGMAIANQHDCRHYRVFVLLSDGECDEGSVWEAALFAAHFKLDNLIAIIDYNKIQSFGRVKDVINLEPLLSKWIAFGWSALEINGHDYQQIEEALRDLPKSHGTPNLIIAHTVKGKGVSFMEDQLAWHYKSPDERQLQQALAEIEWGSAL